MPVRKIVISKDSNFHPKEGYEIARAPEEVMETNSNMVATSGPTLNQYLIDSGLVDKILYHQVPATVEDGIKPYQNRGFIEIVKLEIG